MGISSRTQRNSKPSLLISAAILFLITALTIWVRFHLFSHPLVALSYGWPLLICLWHQDRRLLWALTAVFGGFTLYQFWFLLGGTNAALMNCILQWINIGVVAWIVHWLIGLSSRLRTKRSNLERANQELAARDRKITAQNEQLRAQAEELSRQNEEILRQTEELAQQNEELQHQSTELEEQADELRVQTEELQSINVQLNQRESLLKTMLHSMRLDDGEQPMIDRICSALVTMLGDAAGAAAVVERVGEDLVVRTRVGPETLGRVRWPFKGSFASVVMEHNRTAYVDDLCKRRDLLVPQPPGVEFRSMLATPLRLNGACVGALKVYSRQPRQWSSHEFEIIEWVAAQCSVALELMRLHQELRGSELELKRINAALENKVQERTSRLQEMVDELEHFSYCITHDMRAPLRAMQGFAGLVNEACRDSLKPEHRDYLDRIMTSAIRMDRLITDALSYSKALKHQLALAPVDVIALLKGMVQSYPDFQPPRSRIRIQESIPLVLGNEAGLTQCFSNLLGNAVKFVQPGQVPEIDIYATQSDGMVRLWFQDNGIGISKASQTRLFQMFQRATRTHEGTGIGLALVKKVTERMGGRVGVESDLGSGSRFWLDLHPATVQTDTETGT